MRSARDFRAVYEGRLRVRNEALIVCYRPNEYGRSRLGLSVSRRNGPAVRRNRIKRVLREAFRLERARVPDGVDLVLIPADPELCARLATAQPAFRALMRKLERRLAGPSA